MRPFVRVLIAGLVALVVWTLTKEDNLRQRISGTPVSKEAPVVVGHEVWHTKSSRGICQLLPPHWQHASALALWTENIGKIHNASQLLPMDAQYEFSDLNAILLHLISPRLPNSVKALPRDWKDIKHVLEEVVYPRWRYIMHAEKQGDKIPRPAKIVIMGGSVVAGVNCLQVFSNKVKHQLTREQCAWPHRLQQFLDSIVGGQEKRIFEVHTFAMGGGNTVSLSCM